MQGLTGDKPGILGRQKHRGPGDLFRLRHAAEREVLDQLNAPALRAREG